MLPLVSPRKELKNSILMTYHHPDLDNDTLSVLNFCYRSSDVISQETSCSVGKYRLFSRSPKRTWEEREKVILAMKIIVAGLKIREIHEEYVINSLQQVINYYTKKRNQILYFYKHVFENRK